MASPEEILNRLETLRSNDAPTHGGRVLSYVYDSGLPELDALAASAMELVQPVNGLDPTTFTSVAAMEREVIEFARNLLHGDQNTVGTITSGGTESCLLAVKRARTNYQGAGAPKILAPSTVHAAFHKAAEYFELELDLVPVQANGQLQAARLIERMDENTALVVISAPAYPYATLDPITEIAAVASVRGIECHVDACIGGWILPFWPNLPEWDLRVRGVTSIAADLHKYGYAPKGISVLLTQGRDTQRSQYFATTNWPGYPVVNSTLLGSKSAAPLAAAWAIINYLGETGFQALAESTHNSTQTLLTHISSIKGLRVLGSPTGPLFAVAQDDSLTPETRIDPHLWADRLGTLGWRAQLQPAYRQPDGTTLPRTTHLTITPVTAASVTELCSAMTVAAQDVRGVPGINPQEVLASLDLEVLPELNSQSAQELLTGLGLADNSAGLPAAMAQVMALIEALPASFSQRLLVELMARLIEP
ncbi:aminotransferase class V-fold PLP-dependent enzyme [Arthrobacter sp. MYb227]|uniref:pyridoxal phosphate-dependent decarboxylase family protein n=1 Tax=Arthrobacter sp. MYb227 TaxID=1848601 RepID=UPI002157576C|nr:aminotransferase class V-fold PLP-dependent enzyme [Arthrobacter sp. MYb227]